MRNQWSVSSHDGAMARYTVNTLLTSLIGLKERCVFCGEKPNKYIWQDIPQSMRPLQNVVGVLKRSKVLPHVVADFADYW